jgi:hypothetical protein
MFKIDEFISSINKNGVIKTNRFTAFFTLPEYLRGREVDYGYQDKLISLRCESAQFPGISFGAIDGPPRLGYGAVESIPYNVAFEDVSLTFLVDAHTRIHKLFYDWVNTIVNFQGSKGQSDWKKESNSITKAAAYEVGYKDKYRTDILVTVYDSDDKQIMTVKIYNAYPKLLPSTDLSWGSNDELMKMTIPFSFTDFDVTYHRSDQIFNTTTNVPAQQTN